MIFGKMFLLFSFDKLVSVSCFSVMTFHQGKFEDKRSRLDEYLWKSQQELELGFYGRKICEIAELMDIHYNQEIMQILWYKVIYEVVLILCVLIMWSCWLCAILWSWRFCAEPNYLCRFELYSAYYVKDLNCVEYHVQITWKI